MNKKILIASLFATFMLLVPMTSVVGVSDVEEDCGCQVVNSSDLFRVKLLLVRLKVYINIILLRFGYIPEVAEKCEEILDIINSDRQLDFPIICAILESIFYKVVDFVDYMEELWSYYKDNPVIRLIISGFSIPFGFIAFYILYLAGSLNCEWEIP